ncbi:alpha/beta hydrolase family protein [Shewanella youngdeokensis]|uniref:Acetylhydrolase n=1 Tax=Shewanella youngdeokensis TaxID=2999068 RepID=A0ABZ0JXL4_9GAMM|nr:acetylhydrolase [Shewanella sp. DAU334]
MLKHHYRTILSAASLGCCNLVAHTAIAAEQLYPNILPTAAAPALSAAAQAGQAAYAVGVRTLTINHANQFDAISQTVKDRPLTLEVWYPAALTDKQPSLAKTSYHNQTRLGHPFEIAANAYRDAAIAQQSKQTFPLVVLSHGYTGYRTIMFYLAEHLAANGYIVAAIDHTDSTNAEVNMVTNPFSGFFSTLLNRSRDQQFTLDYLTSQPHFATNIINKDHAGLVGYSMGGFGAINTVGACYQFNDAITARFTGTDNPQIIQQAKALLNTCTAGHPTASADPKWQAAVAMAPWGGQDKLFSTQSLQKIKVPMLYMAGDLDDISGYASIKDTYRQTGAQRYLLTYHNARHNIAPHPAPQVAYNNELDLGHYFEPAWRNSQLNSINEHFVLAMMNCHVKKQPQQCQYLQLTDSANQQDANGKKSPPWFGFPDRYATGMSWQSDALQP